VKRQGIFMNKFYMLMLLSLSVISSSLVMTKDYLNDWEEEKIYLNSEGTPTGGKGVAATYTYNSKKPPIEFFPHEKWPTCASRNKGGSIDFIPGSEKYKICLKLKAMLDLHSKNISFDPVIKNQFYRTEFTKKGTGEVIETSSKYDSNNPDILTRKEVDTTDTAPKLLPLFKDDLEKFFSSNSVKPKPGPTLLDKFFRFFGF
jgi:hypothetical protein